MRHVPLRTCLVSREKMAKTDLIRIVRTVANQVQIDYTYTVLGRGAYLKKDRLIIAKAQRSGIINRRLKCVVPDEIFQELLERYG